MPTSQPARPPRSGPSRIEQARARAAVVRRGVVVAAVGSFGVVLLLVRTSHPAHASGAGTLAAPSALVAEIESPALGGGSIAAASGPAAVATSSS